MKELLKYCLVLFFIVELFFFIKIGKIPTPNFLLSFTDSKRMLDGDTIYIQGAGRYNNKVLINAKQIIEETYSVPAKIIDPIQLTSDYYVNNSICGDKCINDFDDDKNKILLTNEKCLTSEDNTYVNGLSESYGNIVIINEQKYIGLKRVIIHEIGHNSGFEHCQNKNCVMSINRNDDVHTLSFCDDCNNNSSLFELNKRFIKSLLTKRYSELSQEKYV